MFRHEDLYLDVYGLHRIIRTMDIYLYHHPSNIFTSGKRSIDSGMYCGCPGGTNATICH